MQQQQRTVNQPDPESLRREREALESICHAMSECVAPRYIIVFLVAFLIVRHSDVVDIFTALPESSVQSMEP